jgi:hypothetical protein
MECGDCFCYFARVPRATSRVDFCFAARLCAIFSGIHAGVFDRVGVPDGPLPITRLERLADALSVDLAVAPEWTRALVVLPTLVPVRAFGGVPAPET